MAQSDITIVGSAKAYLQALNEHLARISGRSVPVLEHVYGVEWR